MSRRRMMNVEEEQAEEAQVLPTYNPCGYYVQSPSSLSRPTTAYICYNNRDNNSSSSINALHIPSPPRPDNDFALSENPTSKSQFSATADHFSRYPSSRGSNFNHSFLLEPNKDSLDYCGGVFRFDGDVHSLGGGDTDVENEEEDDDDDDENGLVAFSRSVDCKSVEDEDDEEAYYGGSGDDERLWWVRLFSFGTSPSCGWICLQICWRLLVSLGFALLVFYLATDPPPPRVSVQIAGIREFELGEGVDGSGVGTKILTINCSVNLIIDNRSKLFGLHIRPPLLAISFSTLPFATSSGPEELYAGSYGRTVFRLFVGTRNRAMYGAGSSMWDALQAGKGLPVTVRVRLTSSFRVVWNLISPTYRHRVRCSLLLLSRVYDSKHHTMAYNSNCLP